MLPTLQSKRMGFARLAAAALISVIGLAAAPPPASAADFFANKSAGLKKCVRAILGGYEANKVNVLGHHFNCKRLYRDGNRRTIWLSHEQFGQDDQIFVHFTVDSQNVINRYSLRGGILKGVSIKTFNLVDHLARLQPDKRLLPPSDDYATLARNARLKLTSETHAWQWSVQFIVTVVIAELGNPENRGTAPRQANCTAPTFYEHDNFRGRAYQAIAPQSNLRRVYVLNQHMDNRISSLCVPRGWIVTLYNYADFKGNSMRIVGPRAYEDLKRQKGPNGVSLNWGDKVSSVGAYRPKQ